MTNAEYADSSDDALYGRTRAQQIMSILDGLHARIADLNAELSKIQAECGHEQMSVSTDPAVEVRRLLKLGIESYGHERLEADDYRDATAIAGPIFQLVLAYESVLTEMRSHALFHSEIRSWVYRLDNERDTFLAQTSDVHT